MLAHHVVERAQCEPEMLRCFSRRKKSLRPGGTLHLTAPLYRARLFHVHLLRLTAAKTPDFSVVVTRSITLISGLAVTSPASAAGNI
jgi:hypothetical protein